MRFAVSLELREAVVCVRGRDRVQVRWEGQHRHFLAPCEGERRELRWQRSYWTSRSPLMSAFLMPPWQHSMALAPKKRYDSPFQYPCKEG